MCMAREDTSIFPTARSAGRTAGAPRVRVPNPLRMALATRIAMVTDRTMHTATMLMRIGTKDPTALIITTGTTCAWGTC